MEYRNCPIYAITPIRMFWLTMNEIVGLMFISSLLMKSMGAGQSFLIGYTAMMLLKFTTKTKARGYATVKFYSFICGHKVATRAPWLSEAIAEMLTKMGRLPPASYRNRYHR